MTGTAIGIDVGGTKIAAGLVEFPEAKIIAREVRPTLPQRGADAILEEVVALSQTLNATGTAHAIGLAICELVDLRGNIVSHNCIHWQTADLMKRLKPCVIEADVRAAALGEALFGAGKPYRNFVYVTVGTGISCCLVIDGKPYAGARGLTGTFASGKLPGLDRSLEDFASGAAIARGVSPDSAAEALGAGIGLLVSTLDPEAVVIGGGLGLSGGNYWEALIRSIRRHVWSPLHRDVTIVPAASRYSGIVGAAAAALQQYLVEPLV